MARAKAKEGSALMKKFPSDVVTAESRTGGDPNILAKDTFAPQERPNYRDIFGESPGKKKLSKKNISPNKNFSERKPGKSPSNGQSKSWKDLEIPSPVRVVPKITHRRFISESDHEVRIRQQPCTPPKEEATSPNNSYKCHICSFTSSRLNVIVLHNKAQHSESALAAAKLQTPTGKKKRTPVGRLASASSLGKQKSKTNEVKDTSSRAKKNILGDTEKKKSGAEEVLGEKSNTSVRKKGKTNAKKKRETEVRESLLADWGEEDQEEEEKEIENLKLVLGSSRKLEEESLNETMDETMTSEKEPDTEEISVTISAESPEKTTEKSMENDDLEKEFNSIMDETAVPVMPDVPVISSCIPREEGFVKTENEDKPENEVNDNNIVIKKEVEMAQGVDNKEEILDGEKDEIFNPPNISKVEPERENGNPPCAPPINEEQLEATQSSIIESQESQIPLIKSEVESPIIPPTSHVTPPAASGSSMPTAPVSQETYGILPITSDSQKTEMTTNISVTMPPSNPLVEGLPTRTLVSAASSEEATETATYVLVTIDDSGALQHIDNMNSVVNTALLALDGQQDDGPRTLYIDPSQLGSQATDLENIFLAIDTRGDMATQMVELTNRNSDQSEVQGQAFAAAAAASAAKAKSAQDILAVALANTQVFQGDGSYVAINPAASAVTVTSSRTAQAPVMTPRVVDPCRTNAIHSTPTTISSTPVMPDLAGHIGEVQRPVNLPPPTIESPSFHSQLPPPAQTLSTIPSVIHPTTQATVVTLPTTLPHLNSDDSTSHLDTSTMSSILTLPSLIPPSYAPIGVGNGQTAATLTLISGANLIMDQVTQALPKVGTDSVVETSRDHVAEKRKLECDVRESKQMRVDENGGS